MSKLSRLKQEAYQAAKKRDWQSAVSVYKRILELDKNNPTVVNELGDICLKMGDGTSAISHFLTAAAKYRSTGLQNNAVAIYKKILRHDGDNLNAHWYLAEIRASQGLMVEGEGHAHAFLSASENLSTEVKDIYLKRCAQLFKHYPESRDILERLRGVFNLWSQPIEEARVTCLLARVLHQSAEPDEAADLISLIRQQTPEIVNYEEYQAYQKCVDPDAVFGHPADVNSINLISDPDTTPTNSEYVTFNLGSQAGGRRKEASLPGTAEPTTLTVNANPQSPGGARPATESAATSGPAEPQQEPRVQIDLASNTSLDEAVQEAAAAVAEPAADSASAAGGQTPVVAGADSVDLLAEILAEDDIDLASEAACQLDTIASEIGQQVGGGEALEASDRQYEMGMVYLEMGLFDQACECFSTAAADPEFSLRSYEMWGIALSRQENFDEAISVLARGLQIPVADPREQLGLIYHTGRAHEAAGNPEEARAWYTRAGSISPSFQDVQNRLDSLPAV